jgi:pimeloyl-ACP methyl ester carboxylesterase
MNGRASKKNIYLFGGLGTDERVFQRLDLSAYNITPVKWIPPLKNISLEAYASELIKQIKTENPVLIGISFGGMMAVETGKLMKTEKIILISSVKTKYELPFYYRVMGKLHIHKLVPPDVIKNSYKLNDWLFGAKTPADKVLLKQIIGDTDPVFLKWAIDRITRWQNKTFPGNTFHIHGTKDRVLPIRFVNCDRKIEGGSHLMILDKADEVTAILKEHIQG